LDYCLSLDSLDDSLEIRWNDSPLLDLPVPHSLVLWHISLPLVPDWLGPLVAGICRWWCCPDSRGRWCWIC
jgi:hypothetical protein